MLHCAFDCISFMISDVELVFMYLLAIYLQVFLGENVCSVALPIFLIGNFVSFCFAVEL